MKNMDRKHCVLFYSRFSPASQKIIEYIQSLSYDLPRLTGLTMVCVDSDFVRNKIYKYGITVVPCLFIQYFDGEQQLLTNTLINDWISEVTQITLQEKKESDSSSITNLSPPPPSVDDVVNQPSPSDKKLDVMSMAMSMQKTRENDDKIIDKKKHL